MIQCYICPSTSEATEKISVNVSHTSSNSWWYNHKKTKHNKTVSIIDGMHCKYHQVSNIIPTLVGNKIVDHSDVVGASPVGAAPTTSSFST